MNLAQIENGVVVNIIVVNPDNIPEFCADWPEITEGGIGWAYDGESFIEPEPPAPEVPVSVKPAALRLVLHRIGILDVVNQIAASDVEAHIVWEYALDMARHSPLLVALAENPIRPFSEAEIDQIFIAAGELDH